MKKITDCLYFRTFVFSLVLSFGIFVFFALIVFILTGTISYEFLFPGIWGAVGGTILFTFMLPIMLELEWEE